MKGFSRSSIKTVLAAAVVAAVAAVAVLPGCTRSPLKGPENAFRKAEAPEAFSDDLPLEPLIAGVRQQIELLSRKTLTPAAENSRYVFGDTEFTREEYVAGLRRFVSLYEGRSSREDFFAKVIAEFDFFEVYGEEEWGRAFMTSYYEPVIEGSRVRTERFSRPLYEAPKDIIEVDVREFLPVLPDDAKLREALARLPVLRGRLHKEPTLRGNRQLIPYDARAEIDEKGSLDGRSRILAWVDPLEAFFLQIQGSGTVRFQDRKGGEIRVGYAEQNGHPYVAVGKFLKHAIPLESMTLQSIEQHLRSLPKEEMQAYLNLNPSYVFFRELKTKPVTFLGTPVVDGRTIATDARYFPKGAIGFVKFEKPVFREAPGAPAGGAKTRLISAGAAVRPEAGEAAADPFAPDAWEPASRFVIDQDKGGAIRGGGRLDLYWGSGPEAKRAAGVMKQWVKLYYLAPKQAGR